MNTRMFLLFVAVLFGLSTLLMAAPATAEMGSGHAHNCCQGPLPETAVPPTPQKVIKKSGIDHQLLAQAVFHVLKYDGSRQKYEAVQPLVLGLIAAAEKADIDPFLVVAIVFQESRYKPTALGDGGHACGMAQQHARFSMGWGLSDVMSRFDIKDGTKRKRAQRKYECEKLKDPEYATKVMIHHLVSINKRTNGKLERYVWWYNGSPNPWMTKHLKWRGLIKDTYKRVVAKDAAKLANKGKGTPSEG